MNEIEERIITEAKSWKGTKWKHNVSRKGFGTDCVQFIISIGKEFDWIPKEYSTGVYRKDYFLHNSKSILLQEIEKFCYRVTVNQCKIGDIFIYEYGKTATHAGIYIGNNMIIHSHIKQGVIEADFRNVDGKLNSVWRANG